MRALVLFDVDGTVVRAGDPDHKRAFEEALSAVHGIRVSLSNVPIELGGRIDADIARAALAHHGVDPTAAEASLPRVMEVMGDRYRRRVGPGQRRDWVLPGVPAVVRRLRAAGHVVGVLTGNAREVGTWKLEAAGLADLCEVGAYGDRAGERWELVADACTAAHRVHDRRLGASQAVLVGDTPRDVAAAHRVGARAVAVATGRFSTDELAAAGADAWLPDLADVDRAVAAIEGADQPSSRSGDA